MKRWLSWWQLSFSRARDESKEKAPKAEREQRKNKEKGSGLCHVFACINFRFTSAFEAAEDDKSYT
jgi:hypothetical protein